LTWGAAGAAQAAISIDTVPLGNAADMRPHGVMFHHFHNKGHIEAQGSISAGELVQMIEFLGRERILPARVWMDRALSGDLSSDDLCLTFDDGLLCQYDVAFPVLHDLGLTAFWFVYTAVMEGSLERLEIYRKFRCMYFRTVDEFYAAFFSAIRSTPHGQAVDRALAGQDMAQYLKEFPFYTLEDRRFRYVRDNVLDTAAYNEIMDEMIREAGASPAELAEQLWMDYDCLRRLHAEGHVIGLHSHTHPIRIEHLNAAEQDREYMSNYNCLRVALGESPKAMSHPCNSYNGTTLGILSKMGIRLGFRANMAQPQASEYEWPREDHANILKAMARCNRSRVEIGEIIGKIKQYS
jgi:peptidoglycan/xylan/chitin deacetylase (PgdA/CDA1 family)